MSLLPTLSYAQIVEPDTIWTKTYGGDNADIGVSVQHTYEGGYIICGSTESFGTGGYDVWLLKTDSLGDTVWTQTYGSLLNDWGWWVEQTPDSGFIIAGAAKSLGTGPSDLWLIKTDSHGDTTWTKTYGGMGNDYARSVKTTFEGGYIICGASSSFNPHGDCDVYLIKTDSLGDAVWTKTYGDTGEDAGRAVHQTRDYGYIVVGEIQDVNLGDIDVYIIKTDSLGDTLWTKVYGKFYDDKAHSVYENADDNYIITGYTEWPSLGSDIWLLKVDITGDTLWVKQYGDTGDEAGGSVFQTTDGGYIICGYSNSYGTAFDAVYVLRADSLGEIVWTKTIGGNNTENRGYSIQSIAQGEYILTGYSNTNNTSKDVYLVRLGKTESITETTEKPVAYFTSPTIIRGPLVLPENKKCKVYDITGRTVDANKLAPGIYFIEIEGQITHKTIKVR
ncbi:hypothetical protein AMJ52_09205 [candidate division TA06 bacterium DG_78]|uniref:Secretion system C-terminal sorting domain-containing protein n=1 Tax=candidate division TA06 bacterium DG_78 TaxID=1703772 RepID=A0A0S7Y8I2_UNCT6|nr:MAG: hypothetical protein AMJ52_09205 [candidate division TA06 bacterium DG_78]